MASLAAGRESTLMARQLRLRLDSAAGSTEGSLTWDAEEDNFLVGPLLGRIVLLGETARGGISVGDGCPSV
jgi:hypothetical protein